MDLPVHVPSTAALRHLAALTRERADTVRAAADAVERRARAAPWEGVAADAMRDAVAHHAGQLRRTAELHDAAAAALLEHAGSVEQALVLVAAVEEAARSLVTRARERLGVLGDLADPLDHLLDRFRPPPSGSPDWLVVDVPGLAVASVRVAQEVAA